VLGGGGTAGGAWMLGLLHALRESGTDLGAAARLIGTSAGARVAAVLAGGRLPEVVEMYRRRALPPLEVTASMNDFVDAVGRVLGRAPDRSEAVRRIADLGPLGPSLVSPDARRRMIEAHSIGREWPARPLGVVAVDAGSGERVMFDSGSDVDLVDAVTASGALPGIFPLVPIAGRRYADGGVHSPFNADLAAEADAVVVVTPMALATPLDARLRDEIGRLAPAEVVVVHADADSLAALGTNPLASDGAAAALAAGIRQASGERARLSAAGF
jgi:NTE family protein